MLIPSCRSSCRGWKADVPPARVHQDVCAGGFGARDHGGACADPEFVRGKLRREDRTGSRVIACTARTDLAVREAGLRRLPDSRDSILALGSWMPMFSFRRRRHPHLPRLDRRRHHRRRHVRPAGPAECRLHSSPSPSPAGAFPRSAASSCPSSTGSISTCRSRPSANVPRAPPTPRARRLAALVPEVHQVVGKAGDPRPSPST